MGQLKNEVRLQMKLIYGLVVLLEVRLGCQLLEDGVLLVLALMWELYRNQNLSLHNQYIHSFSITGDL